MIADMTPIAPTTPNTISRIASVLRPLPLLLVPGVLEGGFEDIVEVVGVDITPGAMLDDKVLVLDDVLVIILDAVLIIIVEMGDGLEDVIWEEGKAL
jgi:hypothetical protein